MNYKFQNFSVIVPVHNEELILEDSAIKIQSFCLKTNLDFEIIFSENGSTDNTKNILENLSKEHSNIKYISYDAPNYGMAIKNGLKESKNEIVVIFDVDYFSEGFLQECLKLDDEYSAIMGSKRLADSDDNRSYFRVFISYIYTYILKLVFGTKLSDTHGMKAIKREAFSNKLNKIESDQWMFDTELLIRIERNHEKIMETPVVVTELRPSVYSIGLDIPKTLFLIFKLRIKLLFEND